MHIDWARSLRDQCVDAEVPFFFKQWGEWYHDSFQDAEGIWQGSYGTHEPWHLIARDGHIGPIPYSGWGRERETVGWAPMGKLGKHSLMKSGVSDLLDGERWAQMPTVEGETIPALD